MYLSFHWSECDQNFREDPSQVPDPIPIKIKIPNPKKETPVSSKAPNQDFKNMVVLCILKIKVESQNLEQGTIKDHNYL